MDFLLKNLYFFSGFSSASGPLYLPLYLDHYFSLRKEQIGLLLSIIPVLSFISTPLLTWIGESWIGLKNAAIICTIFGIITFDLYAIILPDSFTTLGFIIGLCVLNAFLASPLGTILDSLVLILSKDYGKQRLWCSVSWGIGSLCTGLVIDYMGLNFMFVLFTMSSLIFLLLLLFLPSCKSESGCDCDSVVQDSINSIQESEQTPLLERQVSESRLSTVLFKSSTILFLFSITLIGMVFSLIQSFLFIFMSRELLISSSIIGLTTPLSILFELPVFYYSEDIIKIMGTSLMMILVHILLISRLLIYMILNVQSAIFILPVELIHGLAFALTWAGGLEYTKRNAPESNKSTFVAIFCTLYNNVGGFLGTYIGGRIYEDYGHIYLWMFCILLLLVSMAAFLMSRVTARSNHQEAS